MGVGSSHVGVLETVALRKRTGSGCLPSGLRAGGPGGEAEAVWQRDGGQGMP